MPYKFLFISLLFSSSLFFTSCDPEVIDPPVDPELITTLNYTLTPMGGGTAVMLSFQDIDGDGGNAPIITDGVLAANQTYTGAIELLNESESPAENITEEIEAEDDEHQFFYQTSVSDLSLVYTDQDGNGNPIGLTTTLTTGDAASGNLTIILRHQPDKSASEVSNGDISNAGGETDIEVTFPISVQ